MIELAVEDCSAELDRSRLLGYMLCVHSRRTANGWVLYADDEIERPGDILALDYNGTVYWRDAHWKMTDNGRLFALRILMVQPLSCSFHARPPIRGAKVSRNPLFDMWSKSVATK